MEFDQAICKQSIARDPQQQRAKGNALSYCNHNTSEAMTTYNQSSKDSTKGWFFPSWAAYHIGSSFLASLKSSWVAPLIFSTYFIIHEPRVRDDIFLVFFVSLLVASVVSFLFSVVVYPLLQFSFRKILNSARSGKEAATIMLPLQQVVIWAVAVGVASTDYDPVWSPANPILLFSSLVSFHAAMQLFLYSKRLWKKREAVLSGQIPTLAYELAATNSEGGPPGFTE